MIPNHSPWLKQLKRTRPIEPIATPLSTDIAIVGGGIAGIVTAYFALKETTGTVTLLEADKVAHGATGHNAGQLASYFERPLADLVAEFGLALAAEGQRSVESAWILLDQIVAEAHLQTPVYKFTGYAGLSTLEQVVAQLQDNHYRLKAGLPTENILVAESWEEHRQIPGEYHSLYTLAPHGDILKLLETDNPGFIASAAYQKGCMNSALFSEEVAGYLLAAYRGRFSLHESSPVKKVLLQESGAVLEVLGHEVRAKRVVLCTNGFEYFSIQNEHGPEIDTNFHHSVAGRIGYMSGYLEPLAHPPIAISYLSRSSTPSMDPSGENYFYLTRRPYEDDPNGAPRNLVCAGGPEKVLPNGADYSRSEGCAEDMRALVDDFLKDNYEKYPNQETEYAFCWHGLMGYTPNRVRRIGPEPRNPVLLYNLGCNGVGILPSVFGGMRIARIIKGDMVEKSIFDPQG